MAGVAPRISGETIPRLPRGVRLRYDERRSEWILLAPERVLKPNGIALEILKRCDGKATLDSIIDDLAAQFAADRAEVHLDVHQFLTELIDKRILELG